MLCSGQNEKAEAFPRNAYNPSAWFRKLLPLGVVPAENVTFKCIFELTQEMYMSMSFAKTAVNTENWSNKSYVL